MKDDTIAALSTAHGRGAVALIRLSGSESLPLLKSIFTCKGSITERRVMYGIVDTGSTKDDVTAVFYRAPKSYTGEDAAEIFCHGSPVIVESILRALIKNGARAASKGEFTRRAYENGKLSLSEAEGIIDLIEAQSESAARAAFRLADGQLKKKTEEIARSLKELTAGLNAALDYPEEDLETDGYEECSARCKEIRERAEKLAETYENGKKARDGISVVIVGEPNAGKSTLLNALVGFERAIVTDEAGTTRDTVDGSYVYNGTLFKVTDTAGVRKDYAGEAERLGIERSFEAVKKADAVLLLDDSVACETNAPVLKIKTKSDLVKSKERFNVSGKTGENIEELKKLIYDSAKISSSGEVMLTNLRQYEALTRCAAALKRAQEGFDKNTEAELVTVDLLEAMSAIGSVDGATATAEVVDGIFERFCVGK